MRKHPIAGVHDKVMGVLLLRILESSELSTDLARPFIVPKRFCVRNADRGEQRVPARSVSFLFLAEAKIAHVDHSLKTMLRQHGPVEFPLQHHYGRLRTHG